MQMTKERDIDFNNLDNCFICQSPVIDFDFHSTYFDTFELEEKEEAALENAFGTCHASCLTKSKCGSYWFDKLKTRLQTTYQLKTLGNLSQDGLSFLGDNNEIILLFSNGIKIDLEPEELDSLKLEGNFYYFSRMTELNIEFTNREFAESLRKKLKTTSRIPLSEIVNVSGQATFFPNKDFLNRAFLEFDEDLEEEWIGNWISCLLSYQIPVNKKDLDSILQNYNN
ncbi:MAG: hypothetical protein ACJASQ_004310 [Crocinitomicaceae bacterium]|jgi:hypothetical protein